MAYRHRGVTLLVAAGLVGRPDRYGGRRHAEFRRGFQRDGEQRQALGGG